MSDLKITKAEEQMIREHRRKMEKANLRQSSDYTEAEKLAAFERLHKLALDTYEKVKLTRYEDDNTSRWFFETVMELLGKDVWKTYNEFFH